jgi:hypothetical protein
MMASALGEGLAEKVNQNKEAAQEPVVENENKPAKKEKVALVNRADESRSPYVSCLQPCLRSN